MIRPGPCDASVVIPLFRSAEGAAVAPTSAAPAPAQADARARREPAACLRDAARLRQLAARVDVTRSLSGAGRRTLDRWQLWADAWFLHRALEQSLWGEPVGSPAALAQRLRGVLDGVPAGQLPRLLAACQELAGGVLQDDDSVLGGRTLEERLSDPALPLSPPQRAALLERLRRPDVPEAAGAWPRVMAGGGSGTAFAPAWDRTALPPDAQWAPVVLSDPTEPSPSRQFSGASGEAPIAPVRRGRPPKKVITPPAVDRVMRLLGKDARLLSPADAWPMVVAIDGYEAVLYTGHLHIGTSTCEIQLPPVTSVPPDDDTRLRLAIGWNADADVYALRGLDRTRKLSGELVHQRAPGQIARAVVAYATEQAPLTVDPVYVAPADRLGEACSDMLRFMQSLGDGVPRGITRQRAAQQALLDQLDPVWHDPVGTHPLHAGIAAPDGTVQKLRLYVGACTSTSRPQLWAGRLVFPEHRVPEALASPYRADDTPVLLAGVVPAETGAAGRPELFVLFDAGCYTQVKLNQLLSVETSILDEARQTGFANPRRVLRDGKGAETLVVVNAANLAAGIAARLQPNAVTRLLQALGIPEPEHGVRRYQPLAVPGMDKRVVVRFTDGFTMESRGRAMIQPFRQGEVAPVAAAPNSLEPGWDIVAAHDPQTDVVALWHLARYDNTQGHGSMTIARSTLEAARAAAAGFAVERMTGGHTAFIMAARFEALADALHQMVAQPVPRWDQADLIDPAPQRHLLHLLRPLDASNVDYRPLRVDLKLWADRPAAPWSVFMFPLANRGKGRYGVHLPERPIAQLQAQAGQGRLPLVMGRLADGTGLPVFVLWDAQAYADGGTPAVAGQAIERARDMDNASGIATRTRRLSNGWVETVIVCREDSLHAALRLREMTPLLPRRADDKQLGGQSAPHASPQALELSAPPGVTAQRMLAALLPTEALALARTCDIPTGAATLSTDAKRHYTVVVEARRRLPDAIRRVRQAILQGDPLPGLDDILRWLRDDRAGEYMGSDTLAELLRDWYGLGHRPASSVVPERIRDVYGVSSMAYRDVQRELVLRLAHGAARAQQREGAHETSLPAGPVVPPPAVDEPGIAIALDAVRAADHVLAPVPPLEQRAQAYAAAILALQEHSGLPWPPGISLPVALAELVPDQENVLRAHLGIWPYTEAFDAPHLARHFGIATVERAHALVEYAIFTVMAHAQRLSQPGMLPTPQAMPLERLFDLLHTRPDSVGPAQWTAIQQWRGLGGTHGAPLTVGPATRRGEIDPERRVSVDYYAALRPLTGDARINPARADGELWTDEWVQKLYRLIDAGETARSELLLAFDPSLEAELGSERYRHLLQLLGLHTEADTLGTRNIPDEAFADMAVRFAVANNHRERHRQRLDSGVRDFVTPAQRAISLHYADAVRRHRARSDEIERYVVRAAALDALRTRAAGRSVQDLIDLMAVVDDGQRAMAEFVMGNMKLALYLARLHGYRADEAGTEPIRDDAVYGLEVAVRRHDPRLARFTSYAMRAIQSAMVRRYSRRVSAALGVSTHRASAVINAGVKRQRLRAQLEADGQVDRPIEPAELARAVYEPLVRERLKRKLRREPLPQELNAAWEAQRSKREADVAESLELWTALNRIKAAKRLDATAHESHSAHEVVASRDSTQPSATGVAALLQPGASGFNFMIAHVVEALERAGLSDDEQYVLLQRFGVAGVERSAEEIAEAVGRTAAQVEAAYQGALAKVRDSSAALEVLARYRSRTRPTLSPDEGG
jgi:hypothetical protein